MISDRRQLPGQRLPNVVRFSSDSSVSDPFGTLDGGRHADRECPRGFHLQSHRFHVEEFLGVTEPFRSVQGTAEDDGAVVFDAEDTVDGPAVDSEANFVKAVGDAVGYLAR